MKWRACFRHLKASESTMRPRRPRALICASVAWLERADRNLSHRQCAATSGWEALCSGDASSHQVRCHDRSRSLHPRTRSTLDRPGWDTPLYQHVWAAHRAPRLDYPKPAHTHFVELVEPLPVVVPDQWELALGDLGETADLHSTETVGDALLLDAVAAARGTSMRWSGSWDSFWWLWWPPSPSP